MRIVLYKLLDLLFPPRPTELLIRSLKTDELASLKTFLTKEGTTSLLSYQHNQVKALITENKFYNSRRAQQLLAAVLDDWLSSCTERVWLLPIPLSQARQRSRGHNQVLSVIEKTKNPHVELIRDTLIKHRDTVPQTSLTRSERLTNLRGTFSLQQSKLPAFEPGDVVLLVDDVLTTGATLAEASRVLEDALPEYVKLERLTFAH